MSEKYSNVLLLMVCLAVGLSYLAPVDNSYDNLFTRLSEPFSPEKSFTYLSLSVLQTGYTPVFHDKTTFAI